MGKNTITNNRKSKALLYGFMAFLLIIIYFRSTSFRISDESFVVYNNSYYDGFVSAGLIGTLWQGFCNIFSIDYMSYIDIYRTGKIMLIVYYILFLLVLCIAINRSDSAYRKNTVLIAFATIVLSGSMFANGSTLGYFDMYMAIVLMLSMIVLLLDRGWFLLPILSLIGILIHPSYLIKCMPVIIALLIYNRGKRDRIIAVISVTTSAVLYIISEAYVMLFSGEEATSSLVPSWSGYIKCYIDLVLYIIFMIPFIIIGIRLYRRIRKDAGSKDKKIYSLLNFLIMGIIIEFVVKTDYGFLIYYVWIYYLLIMMYQNSRGDKCFTKEFEYTVNVIKDTLPVPVILLAYPVIFIPITRTNISSVCSFIAELFV